MRDKTPMEYLVDFFTELIKILYRAASRIGVAGYEAWQRKQDEKKKNELVDANKNPKRKMPKEIENKMSKDNMDISVEDYKKLSRKEKKKYKAEWNALSEQERNKRREEFAKKQMPELRKATNEYFQKQFESVKEVNDLMPHDGMNITNAKWNSYSKKDREYLKGVWEATPEEQKKELMEKFMKEQQPKIDEAIKKNAPAVYKKFYDENSSQVSLFSNVEQRVPKRVADEMAFEFRSLDGSVAEPLPISRGDWEKMSAKEHQNYYNAWNKLKPEEKRARLREFERGALPKMDKAWKDYERGTGNIQEVQVGAFSHNASYYVNNLDKQIKEQKKKAAPANQNEELQEQKLDGKQDVEQELKDRNPEHQEEKNNETVRQEQNELNQSFGGRRREDNQLNRQLNEQVNNLANNNKDENKDERQRQNAQPPRQEERKNDAVQDYKDILKEEEREEFRERVKKGAENRNQPVNDDKGMRRDGPQNDGNVLKDNNVMIPNK